MKELRNFAGTDFYAYQGATDFPNGDKPMIAEGENAILLVSGIDSHTDFGIQIICDDFEAFKVYENAERAKSDAKIFCQILDCDLTKEFFEDIGFLVVNI